MKDIGAFVFDLDGVIRYWDPEIVANAERTHGLPAGALLGTAFEPQLLLSVVTGNITDDDWRDEVGQRLSSQHPDANHGAAIAAWSEPAGEIIEGSLEILRRAREYATVCLLTNATDRLDDDLRALDLDQEFDYIFNSSRIGFAKPDDRVFEHIERQLDMAPEQIVYIDDSRSNVDAAATRGWTTLLASPETRLEDLLSSYLDLR